MADTAQLPALPQTVELGAAQIEGDPLEYMRAKARENIDAVEKNPVVKENESIEFKRYILGTLDANIKTFEEIDKKAALKKAEEDAAKAAEQQAKGLDEAKEEDPFADIFKDDTETPDESTIEKQKIAAQFALDTKNYREKFVKNLIKTNEHKAKQKDEEELDDILEQLKEV